MPNDRSWRRCPSFWLELFVLVNLAGLTPDIFLAHSTNAFHRPAEYVPLYFSLGGAALLLVGVLARLATERMTAWRLLGHAVGWASVAVGVVGMILHLQSQFFRVQTLASLVYSAPFAAPLAYVGLGLLLVMNRMVEPASPEWPQWVVFFTLGGFVGNLVFSLTDHAVNGFFVVDEWIPIVSAALAVGFLAALFAVAPSRGYLALCLCMLLVQGVVGLVGFYFHLAADLRGPGSLFENVIYGAPVLAPLLFADLMLLGLLGLWIWLRHLPAGQVSPLSLNTLV